MKKSCKENIKLVEEVLFRNKIGNYTRYPFRLLAYLIVFHEGDKLVQFSYEDKWLENNLTHLQYKRSLAFLKQNDIVQLSPSKDGWYKINYKLLKNIIVEELTINILLEIPKRQKENKLNADIIGKRTKKKKLRAKCSRDSNESFKKSLKLKKLKTLKLNTKKLATNKTKSDNLLLRTNRPYIAKNKDKKSGEVRKFLKATKGKHKSRGRAVRKDSTELYGQFRFNPSENPKLRSWYEREIGVWRSIDFLGYYICLYKRITGFENIVLQNDGAYLKAKKYIRTMLKEWFNQDKKLMRKYFEWGVYHFTHNMNEKYSPSIETLLNPYSKSRWVYDIFVKAQVSGKKRGRKSDLDWSSDEAWED